MSVEPPPPLPPAQLWEISSGELLLSVLFDVGIMAVTMDLAEHHMFCGGSEGSIFQVDLCTWVSGGRLGRGWRLVGQWDTRGPSSPASRSLSQLGSSPAHHPSALGPPGLRFSSALCSLAPRPPQPGQREKSFQSEQDSGKVFKGHRCGDQTDSWGGALFSCSWGWATLSQTCVPRNQVTCLSVSTDGSVLLSGSHDETVRVWDIQSKQCLRTVTLKGGAGAEDSRLQVVWLCPFVRWVGLRSGGCGAMAQAWPR